MLGDMNKLRDKVRAVELALTLSGRMSQEHCPYCGRFDVLISIDKGDRVMCITYCNECGSEPILETTDGWKSRNPMEIYTGWSIPHSYMEHK